MPQWNISHLHSMWEARGHADHHRLMRHPSRALRIDSVHCQAGSAHQRKRSCESTRLRAALWKARWFMVCIVVICTTRSHYSCSKHECQAPGCNRLHSINQCTSVRGAVVPGLLSFERTAITYSTVDQSCLNGVACNNLIRGLATSCCSICLRFRPPRTRCRPKAPSCLPCALMGQTP